MKKLVIAVIFLLLPVIPFHFVQAQSLDYGEGPVLDSDLDGLTDQGEIQIYHTDPTNPDTDGDGIFDGAEILNSTNPLDSSSLISIPELENESEVPWAWYISRSTGIIAFSLLYIVMLVALTIRLPFFRSILSPLHALNIHRWLSVQALIFVFVHGISLVFDEYIGFGLRDVLVPFGSSFEPVIVGLGIISFYLMLLLIVTSYLKNKLPHKLWRVLHFLNFFIYWFVFAHALNVGTDLSSGLSRQIFIALNIFLGVMFLLNFSYRIGVLIRKKIGRKSQVV